jgi:hypothetical protein
MSGLRGTCWRGLESATISSRYVLEMVPNCACCATLNLAFR